MFAWPVQTVPLSAGINAEFTRADGYDRGRGCSLGMSVLDLRVAFVCAVKTATSSKGVFHGQRTLGWRVARPDSP